MGPEATPWIEPSLGEEDFGRFLQEYPGTYFRLGAARPGRRPRAVWVRSCDVWLFWMADELRLALVGLGEQAYGARSPGKTEAGMWGIIKKIKMFNRLEEGGLGEARESGAPPLAPLVL